MRNLHSIQAFTLIEIAVASALFMLAAVVLTEAFVNTLNSLHLTENEADVQADIRFVRSRVILEPDLETFEEGGEVMTLASGTAIWEAIVEPAPVSDLFHVRLSIELTPEKTATPEVHTGQLLLLRPTWSDPVERSEIIAQNADRLAGDRMTRDWEVRPGR